MKKLFIFVAFVAFALLLSSKNINAQQYFVYDGDKFSVMLTCDDANTKVEKVSFSFSGKWNEFTVVGVTDYESTVEGGFVYEVLDGKKQKYFIDYYRDNNHIIVTNEAGNGKWTLKKRKQ